MIKNLFNILQSKYIKIYYIIFNLKGFVTPQTLDNIVQLLRKKTTKKNYQEILIEYLNNLNNSNSKIDFVAKEMKTAFFSCMNDLVLNKNDELKFLILMIEEKYKKLKTEQYFNFWKIFIKNKNIQNKENNNKEETNIDIPEEEDINSSRAQNANENNNIIRHQNYFETNNNNEENNQEYFTIEENNKNSISNNNINELTLSNNDYNLSQYNIPNYNYNNKEKNENLNIDPYNNNTKKINKKEKEKNLIIDYDDETNSTPIEYKSDVSDKNNFEIIRDEKDNNKQNINIITNLDCNNLKEKTINIKDIEHQTNDLNKNYIKDNLNINYISKEENKNNNNMTYNQINMNKNINNKSLKLRNKLIIERNFNELNDKTGKSFSEIEEENRLNYLLSSKNNIGEKEAKSIINLKKTINDAIKKTNYNIQKINEQQAINEKKNIKKNNISNDKENINKQKTNLEIEEIEQITFEYSHLNKTKNTANEPINVENINYIGDSDNKKKNNKFGNNSLSIQKINITPFYNDNNLLKDNIIKFENNSNKINDINEREKFNIIYNNEFSFAPESSHNRESDIYFKFKNKNVNNNGQISNKNSNNELKKINININELNNSNEAIINQKNFVNNGNNKVVNNKNNLINNDNINNININIIQNKYENKERLINEEMIRNFLNNHKNERIFKFNNNNNTELKINKNSSDKNYKNKYLGYTLEGTNRNKNMKNNKTEPNIYKNKLNILENKINDDKIQKIKPYQNKENENDNNISGLNKICNMLDDYFYEDKIKNNIPIFNNEKFDNNKNFERNSNLMKNNNERNSRFINENSNIFQNMKDIDDISKINYNAFDYSNFITNDQIFNYVYDESFQKFNDQKNLSSNKNTNKKNSNHKDYNKININYKKTFKIKKYKSAKKRIIDNVNNDLKYYHNNYSSNKNRKNFPLYNLSFNQRVELFNNKKDLDIEKIKKDIINMEDEICTFYPKTNKKINRINYEHKSKSKSKSKTTISKINDNKKKTKINYKRLNELYMDYKERNIRIKKLEKENNIKDGISFNPHFLNNNHWNKKSKEKIKNIPFLNELEKI